MNISYDYYRIFYYVAKYGSFTRAAQFLLNNQPNITRTIRNLEEQLGCTLFVRFNRGVSLTPEGQELFAHIAPAMQLIHNGEESILLHSTMQRGTVNIGVSEIALHHILLPVLEQFRREYPGIRLRVLNSNSQQAASALKDNLVDLALLTLPVEQPERFVRTDIAHFREVPVCGKQYAAAISGIISLEELTKLPLISLCQGSSTYRFYSEWFRSQELIFSPDIEAATSDQILPMVQANLGIGFVPERTAQKAASNDAVTILSLPTPVPERTISLLKRQDQSLSIAAAKLEEMLLAKQRDIPKN